MSERTERTVQVEQGPKRIRVYLDGRLEIGRAHV